MDMYAGLAASWSSLRTLIRNFGGESAYETTEHPIGCDII